VIIRAVDARYWLGRLQERAFPALERRGFHLTPVDYYQPIPDTRTLPEAIWQRSSELVGVDLREPEQVELVSRMGAAFGRECRQLPFSPGTADHRFYFGNGWFDGIDAELLYCMIRQFKPARVIEVGSGYSTLIAIEAARANATRDGHLTAINAIEPYPREFVVRLAGDGCTLTRTPVEEVPLEVFAELQANDIPRREDRGGRRL
jgi:hypothetical protein